MLELEEKESGGKHTKVIISANRQKAKNIPKSILKGISFQIRIFWVGLIGRSDCYDSNGRIGSDRNSLRSSCRCMR